MPENEVPVILRFLAETSGVKSEVSSLSGQLRGIANVGLGVALGNTLTGFGTSVVDALKRGAESVESFGLSVIRMQRQMGGTSEQASAWVNMFEDWHIAADAGTRSLVFFSRAVRGVEDASEASLISGKSFTGVLQDLGIRTTDAQGHLREYQQVLYDVADAFKANAGSAENGINAQILFGRAGRDLLPILEMGRKGIEDEAAQTKALGIALSGEDTAALKAFQRSHMELDDAIAGVTISIGRELLPVMTHLAEEGARIATTFNQNVTPSIRRLNEARFGAGGPSGADVVSAVAIGAAALVPVGLLLRGTLFALQPFAPILRGVETGLVAVGTAVMETATAFRVLGGAGGLEYMAIGLRNIGTAAVVTATSLGGIVTITAALAALGAYAIWRHSADEVKAYNDELSRVPEKERKAVEAEIDRRLQTYGMATEDITAERARVAREIMAERKVPTVDEAASRNRVAEEQRRRLLEQNTIFSQQVYNVASDNANRAQFRLGSEQIKALLAGVDAMSGQALAQFNQLGSAWALSLGSGLRSGITGLGLNTATADAVKRFSDETQRRFGDQQRFFVDQRPLTQALQGTREAQARNADTQVEANRRIAELQRTESEQQRRRVAEELQANLSLFDVRRRTIELEASERPLRMQAAEVDRQLRDYASQRVELLQHEVTLRAQQAANPALRRQQDLANEAQRLSLEAAIDRSRIPAVRERLIRIAREQNQIDLEALNAQQAVTDAQRNEEDTRLGRDIRQVPGRVAQTQIEEQISALDLVKQRIADEGAAYTDEVALIDLRYDEEKMRRQEQVDAAQAWLEVLNAEQAEYDAVYRALSDAYSKAIAESQAFTAEEGDQVRQRLGLRNSEIEQVQTFWHALVGDLNPDQRQQYREMQAESLPRTAVADAQGGITNVIGPGGAGRGSSQVSVSIVFQDGAYRVTAAGGDNGSPGEIAAVFARAMAEYAAAHDHGASPNLAGSH